MARNDDSQRNTGAPSRVYKSSDVHKRRVDRKGRSKQEPSVAPKQDPPAAQPAGEASANRQQPAGERVGEAVVITPAFGSRNRAAERRVADERTDADASRVADGQRAGDPPAADGQRADERRAADERWFAALREHDGHAGQAATPDAAEAPAVAAETPAETKAPDALADAVPAPSGVSDAAPSPSAAPAGSAEQVPDGRPAAPRPSGRTADAKRDGEPSSTAAEAPLFARIFSFLPKKRSARIALIVGIVALVAAIVAVTAFAWNRWYRFDDHADMQGTWYVVGTTVPISIDESSIHLADDVAYAYEINDHDKTIRYTFGPMEGRGRYWFSDDRAYLAITDGDEFDGQGTAIDDLVHGFVNAGSAVAGTGVKLPEGEGVAAFSRSPNFPVLVRQRVAVSAKAAAEDKARKDAEAAAAAEAGAAAEAAAQAEGQYHEEPYAQEPPAEEAPAGEAFGEGPSETPPETPPEEG